MTRPNASAVKPSAVIPFADLPIGATAVSLG